MLSIGKIAKGQHNYYERQVARGIDDYYAGRGEAPGEWLGAGARDLGLSGPVSRDQFNALIAGYDPRELTRRLRSSEQDPKIAAYDLTFSAPKSLSVLFAVSSNRVWAQLAECHEDAVAAALEYLDDTAAQVRRGHGGERTERATGLIGAAYRHRMSRALDPQLHTHVVVANLAEGGADGRFTALHGTALYRAAKTVGYLYQAHLRALVSERTGLEWGEVHKGAAELRAVAPEVLEHFSQRRHEMLRAAAEQGITLDSRATAELAALSTRERKRYGVETHTWREEVRLRAAEHGLDGEEIERQLQRARERLRAGLAGRSLVDGDALGERLVSPEGLTARANTFTEHEVLQEFAAAARAGALVDEVHAQAEWFMGRGEVVGTARGEMTTAGLVEVERRLIAAVVGRADEHCGVVDPQVTGWVLAGADRPLTEEQAQAVRTVTESGHGVSTIQALAGTGKTYTAGVLREVYEKDGYKVLGVAPTARAVRELVEEAAIQARTLDRALLDIERDGSESLEGSVIVIDEAGMAGTRASAQLLAAAQETGAKVIAIGDPGQLASVQAGGWLGAVGRRLGAVRLTEVMRQRDPRERHALAALHEGRPDTYLRWAQQHERITTHPDHASAIEHALHLWEAKASRQAHGQVVMIARDNETRDALNRGARVIIFGDSESYPDKQHIYGTLQLMQGDRVICRRNDRTVDVDNGMRGTVHALDGEHVTISTDGGPLRTLPAAYVAEHVEHAYALTGHGMQGATVEEAIVLASPHDLSAGWSYTALSRARAQTHLLISDSPHEQEHAELAPQDRTGTSPEELLARAQRRMLERDDEDLAIEQLPTTGADSGRATDPDLAAAEDLQAEPHQEHAAVRAEPDPHQPASAARLRELDTRRRALETALTALATTAPRRLQELDTLALALETERERVAQRRSEMQWHDELDGHHEERFAGEDAAAKDELSTVLRTRRTLASQLDNPDEARSERDSLEQALADLANEHTTLREQLAERELKTPGEWVINTLGERSDTPRQREAWENAVRDATIYRTQYNITDPTNALGPEPNRREQREQQRDWRRAQNAIERAERRLHRTQNPARDTALDLGP
jgi:conjugative relaxase-like TrwC/TraI family protein